MPGANHVGFRESVDGVVSLFHVTGAGFCDGFCGEREGCSEEGCAELFACLWVRKKG